MGYLGEMFYNLFYNLGVWIKYEVGHKPLIGVGLVLLLVVLWFVLRKK